MYKRTLKILILLLLLLILIYGCSSSTDTMDENNHMNTIAFSQMMNKISMVYVIYVENGYFKVNDIEDHNATIIKLHSESYIDGDFNYELYFSNLSLLFKDKNIITFEYDEAEVDKILSGSTGTQTVDRRRCCPCWSQADLCRCVDECYDTTTITIEL